MIPAVVGNPDQDFKIIRQPDMTYRMQMEAGDVLGRTDGLEAVKQAVYKIIMTERYQYLMYSWNYGIELLDLIGEPVTYVCPELKRRITEALLCDDRIESVDHFTFDLPRKGVVHVAFTVHSVFGDVLAEREVNF